MSDMVRTQIELPRDIFDLLKQRGEEYGITPTQQIVKVLTAYLKEEAEPVLQADDPILVAVPTVDSGLGNLAECHDHYLYRKDWQEPGEACS